MVRGSVLTAGLLVMLVVAAAAPGQLATTTFGPRPDDPAINYRGPVSDPVARLTARLADGEAGLEYRGPLGYLESVLDGLDIPIESQLAVFSRNSLQNRHISPSNPRMLFFTDDVVVAGIQGAPLIEIAAVDPLRGVVFYTLEQSRGFFGRPGFVREGRRCLQCHDSLNSLGVPGMLVRSVMPSPDGTANPQLGNHVIDHRSRLEDRWGGYYVTGRHPDVAHLGNGTVTDIRDETSIRDNQELTLDSITAHIDSGTTLTDTSDIVALMVFEHQMHMTNLLVRYGWEVRYAMAGGEEGAGSGVDLSAAAREVVDYMLFVDEADLPGPIEGGSGFRRAFESRGPFDSRGRSLRQLDLDRRLMRYPLSYMIDSNAFDGMPVEARNALYFRLWQILSGRDADPRYGRLSAADRGAILDILRETNPALPAYFAAR